MNDHHRCPLAMRADKNCRPAYLLSKTPGENFGQLNTSREKHLKHVET